MNYYWHTIFMLRKDQTPRSPTIHIICKWYKPSLYILNAILFAHDTTIVYMKI